MGFVNFDNYSFMFGLLKHKLTIKIPLYNRNDRDAYGQRRPANYSVKHVDEPIVNKANPNTTYQNTLGGQYSTTIKMWESLAIKDAPKGTIVIDSKNRHYKVVSSTEVTATDLTYYNLKVVNNHE